VSTASERAIRRFYQISTSAVKDFTWPVLLALLAFITQATLARRGERQQIFNAMLPTLTQLILEHYIPMARRMQTVTLEAAAIEPGPTIKSPRTLEENPLFRTFCAVLLMRRRVLHLFDSNGGIFFRSTVAEDLFSFCLSDFYSNFQTVTGTYKSGNNDSCDRLVQTLSPKMAPYEAYRKIASPRWLRLAQPLYQEFVTWATKPGVTPIKRSEVLNGYLTQLDLATAILTFECNRVYYQTEATEEGSRHSWYFDHPTFSFNGKFSEIANDQLATIRPLYISYLKDMPTECRKGAPWP
jgi:hypothetical protein